MLEGLTIEYIYQFLLIFARLGVAFSFFPVFGDGIIMAKVRLYIAFAVCFVLFPIISPKLPSYVNNVNYILSGIAVESFIGAIISLGTKLIFNCMHSVGQIISMQSGLGAATFFDPSQHEQLALFSYFLFVLTTTTILVSDTHYLFINAVIESYNRFPPCVFPDISDVTQLIIHLFSNMFVLSFKLSAPFIVISFIMMVGNGILARLMPNFQVFFVTTPLQILVIFGVLFLVVNSLVAMVVDHITTIL
jgi:flagellar biosynthetic protein FliR